MILLPLVTLVPVPSSPGATTRAALVPSTSLDTLPVVYMGGNSAARPGPSSPNPFRVSVYVAPTLNATGQPGSLYSCGKSY